MSSPEPGGLLGGPPGGVLLDIPQLPLLQHAQGGPGLGGLPLVLSTLEH